MKEDKRMVEVAAEPIVAAKVVVTAAAVVAITGS
jgi:hypothetical protein